MLTGRRAFEGDDVSDRWPRCCARDSTGGAAGGDSAARPSGRSRVCLRKDPRQRLQAMGDVRFALEGVFETPAAVPAIERVVTRRPLWLRVAPFAAITAVAAAAIGYIALVPNRCQERSRGFKSMRRQDRRFRSARHWPDGRTIVYTVTDSQGVTRLHVRPLDGIETRVLPGTENAVHPFWRANGQSLAFATIPDNYLKLIDVDAGSARILQRERAVARDREPGRHSALHGRRWDQPVGESQSL